MRPAFRPRRPRHAQRGIVLAFTLIALVLLLLGGAALLRTVGGSSLLVGNLAFRRDLTNRAEAAIVAARAKFTAGGTLAAEASREADSTPDNYFASRQATGSNGIPTVLLGSSLPASPAVDGVVLRYVIDRQCLAPGAFSASGCENIPLYPPGGGMSGQIKPNSPTRPVYRISVRVTGPHSTEAFYQTTFAD